ncbi:MAG TPA: hypothetical protein VFH27_03880 [Longimicrobiaceae bacterium]|nr:hypothetical protein [Longimicrobiaceae bacterium]
MQSLRDTLKLLPVEWILWAFDAEWKMTVHEGPGLRRMGVEPGEGVGQHVREWLAGQAAGEEFLRSIATGPASTRLEYGTRGFFVTGAPTPGGGAIGLSLPVAAATAATPLLRPVLEVARPILSVGARTGDLLVPTPDDPGYAGLFRRVPVAELPAEVKAELERLSPPCACAPARPAPGASRSLRERAPHLRLLP